MVKHFLNLTMSNSRSATRIRRQNQVVERSLIGQQPALAQASIRPFLRQPLSDRRQNSDANQTLNEIQHPFTAGTPSPPTRQQAPRRPDSNRNTQNSTQNSTQNLTQNLLVVGNNTQRVVPPAVPDFGSREIPIPIDGQIDEATLAEPTSWPIRL